ncbi:UDP-glycosyltransferase 73C4-like [Salvia miltiorrhiza]|uniref:UDP-glycosyltransferase 73C4-like n=1 Tax=Salvia miltiorrhiza TaxID=226208 RepID=UPI0025ACF6C0|nr:UDP-glycosyltransferase 73C4-like [Salvia miltiorrhiza]
MLLHHHTHFQLRNFQASSIYRLHFAQTKLRHISLTDKLRTMAINAKPPHFVLLPFMAQGHLIPAVDLAKLLAKRGVTVSILVTPKNGSRVNKTVERAIASGLSIRIFHLRLPCAEAGLPEGCEHFDMLPSMHYVLNFFKATAMLREQVLALLLQLNPTCLIADMCFPWATEMARQLGIPRLVFHGTSCFSLACMNLLWDSKLLEDVATDTEYFVVPDLPHRIELTKVQLRGSVEDLSPEWAEIRHQLFNSEGGAAGTVANTFQELETEYVRKYANLRGNKVWCIGPVSLCNVEDSDKEERGNTAAIGGHDCLKWLDSHAPGSVIYVCLGSISRVAAAQLIEMGLGLEASNRPFVWVIRQASDEFVSWLTEEKFEQRIGGRGLLIRGWAPQVLILSHPSVGGFLTHCGWNSTLEGVSAGVPMITWPMFAEQFCNEKFIVNVIKTGVRVGVEIPVVLGIVDGAAVQVRSDDVKMAIDELMEGGEEGAERRERARKLGEAAKRAVEEGGSSQLNMTQLIQDMVVLKAKYVDKSADATKIDEISSLICTPVK